MRERGLEALFVLFRGGGDTSALGKVFDRTAPELLKVARHLTRDAGDAEDLLQATFVTAIERADSFDAGRRIRPWLLGILVKHFQLARRRSNRYLEAGRLELTREREPYEIVEGSELSIEVEKALGELPEVYREVLEPRLRDGTRGVDIARQVGRDPAVVRSQIRRGLSLLRGALPHGLIASLAFLIWSRRALATVRVGVMEHAAASASVPAAVAASTAVGGLIVSKNSLLVAAGLVAVVSGVTWIAWPETGEPGPLDTPAVASAGPGAGDSLVGPSATTVPDRERVVLREEVDVATETIEIAAPDYPPSYARCLSGVTGRLLEASGTPAAGLEISLLEIRPKELFGPRLGAFAEETPAPRVELSQSITDEAGRFFLDGAHGQGLHGLGVDLGGSRAALRVVEVALPPGKVTNLGDIVLDPVVLFAGQVIDEDGVPIAGARVRSAALPGPAGMVGAQHVRSDSSLIKLDKPRVVFEIPGWVGRWIDRLPVPTTHTDDEGMFRLEGVPRGVITTFIDHDDFVAAVTGPTPTGSGTERNLGAITLERGHSLQVRVVDSNGQPMGDAEVLAGPVSPLGIVAFVRPARAGAEAGLFVLDALSEDDELALAVRGSPLDPWWIQGPFDEEEITVTLPAGVSLTVELLDQQGKGVLDADLRVAPVAAAYLRFRYETDHGPAARYINLDRDQRSGPFSIAGLRPGRYEVTYSWGEGSSQPIELVLPPQGNTELQLDFEQ